MTGIATPGRARIAAKTLRTDRWWIQPAVTFAVFLAFIIYATWRAFEDAHYFAEPYLSPFYSPCVTGKCPSAAADLGTWIPGNGWPLSPSLLILDLPAGLPDELLLLPQGLLPGLLALTAGLRRRRAARQVHRRDALPADRPEHPPLLPLRGDAVRGAALRWDAIHAFRNHAGDWGHAGLGTLILIINASLIWAYTLSCHSCRHITGGRLKHFSAHPVRYKAWMIVSKLNTKHMQLAWVSLVWLAVTDFYIRCVATGAISDPRFF